MKTTNINRVIKDFNSLLLPEKEYALEIIRKITIEQKREALAKRIKPHRGNILVAQGEALRNIRTKEFKPCRGENNL